MRLRLRHVARGAGESPAGQRSTNTYRHVTQNFKPNGPVMTTCVHNELLRHDASLYLPHVMTRQVHIQIRVTEEEREQIRERAGEETISDYVRRLALPSETPTEFPETVKWKDLPPVSDEQRLHQKIKAKIAKGRTRQLAEIEAREELGL